MKAQFWLVTLVAAVGGVALGYGVSLNAVKAPAAQAPNLEKHLISLEQKIEKIEAALTVAQPIQIQPTPVAKNEPHTSLTQKDVKDAVASAMQEQRPVDQPPVAVENSASAPVSVEEQVAVDTIVQSISAQNLDSKAVLGSEDMQKLSLAAQNQVMAEITRRLNSGELKTEEFFGADVHKN